MPHSSGGGSHSSGSHSSSSSHSGGSRHREPAKHLKHRRFMGCRTFYIYSHNKPVYVYADYDLSDECRNSHVSWLSIFIGVFFLAVILLFAKDSVIIRSDKLSTDTKSYVSVDDKAGIISDSERDKLYAELNTLYEKTGVATQVLFINNEDWISYYTDLETYAYEQYVTRFGSDETEWLLVYSEPETPNPEFNDWYWEGMIGDYTYKALPQSIIDNFNVEVQNNLYTGTPAEGISVALDWLNKRVDEVEVDTYGVFMYGVIVFIFLANLILNELVPSVRKKKYGCYKEVYGTPKEIVCPYCQGVYIQGTGTTCPHCGAPVRVLEESYK